MVNISGAMLVFWGQERSGGPRILGLEAAAVVEDVGQSAPAIERQKSIVYIVSLSNVLYMMYIGILIEC